MGSWHRQYRGDNIGRVLHFLYHYCGFDVAENATIGNDKVTYHGEVIATFKFLSDTDIPHFTFNPIFSYSGTAMQEMWEENQRTKWHEAIADADDATPKPCDNCRSLRLQLDMQKHLLKIVT
jgi:hypothetical protein